MPRTDAVHRDLLAGAAVLVGVRLAAVLRLEPLLVFRGVLTVLLSGLTTPAV